MRETKKFHRSFHFLNLFFVQKSVFFTMVIKRSPGGESAVLPARAVNFENHLCGSGVISTAFGDRPASSVSKFSSRLNSDLRNGSFGSKSVTLSM